MVESMAEKLIQILLVEDSPTSAKLIVKQLNTCPNFRITHVIQLKGCL